MSVYLGIDWGGTYIKAGVVDSKGKILKKIILTSENLQKNKVFIEEITRLLKELKLFKIKAIGIGVPGIVNVKRGLIYYLPNIKGWKNYPLRDVLSKKLKLPIFVNNDANAFALAEARFGAAKKAARSIFLTLGTGLGGAVIFNGKLLDTEVSALELGHVPFALEKRACGCGGYGCIETFTGNKHLLKRYRELKKHKTKVKEVKEIFELALKGEKEAQMVWKEFSFYLGRFLAGMVNIFNPQRIILGGGISEAFSLFKPYVLEAIKNQAMRPQNKNLKLVKAKLKDAGIVGAALIAKDGAVR